MLAPRRSSAPTVLVVEDDALILISAMMILTDAGYTAIAAGDAAGAMQALDDYPEIDLLFSDIQMPGPMNGLALAEETHRRWPSIRILITSAAAKVRAGDLPEGARFLQKLYSPQEVTTSLGELMATWRPSAAAKLASLN